MLHNHYCTCEHRDVKYCGHCKTVFCRDCNQEWGNQQYWYGNNGYPWTYTNSYDVPTSQTTSGSKEIQNINNYAHS